MKRAAGFTLLEMMLALALLALTLGLLLASSARASRQVHTASAQNQAVWHAENLLDDLGYGTPLRVGEQSGVFNNPRYRWQLRITPAEQDNELSLPMPVAAAPMALYRVELQVSWDAKSLSWQTLRAVRATTESPVP